ncbi:FtsX-like permease family protein [Cellulomonas telluris]|uniref:FtsX-like permease family protein n=1 Tax=Cellulomonas telluris TaxID=2306636 RepID=UPI0010A7A3C6|nr:FtsX-like permease family protein [Cellulomonas telluris]
MNAVQLVRRTAAAHASVPLALAVLVVLVSLAATAAPRLLGDVGDRQVSHEVARAGPLDRDVVAVVPGRWPRLPAPADDAPGAAGLPADAVAVHGGNLAFLERVRAEQPEPLRSVLGDPHLTVETGAVRIAAVPGGAVGSPEVTLKVDPLLGEHVELVAGEWPAAPTVVQPFDDLTDEQYRDLTVEEVAERRARADAATGAFEVALAEAAAEALEWPVGTERAVPGTGVPLRLTGTFRPRDPDESFWAHNPHSASAHVVDDLNLGTSAVASAYLSPAWDGTFPVGFPVGTVSTRAWFPVAPDAVAGDQVHTVLAQTRGLVAADVPWGEGTGATLAPSTGLPDVLEQVRAQQRTTATVLAIVAAGPVGVVVAVFWLGARLVASRRRAALGLVASRGGAAGQLRAALALEGLVLGLPAAAVGALLAVRLVPGGPLAPADLVVPVLVGLVPAAALAAAPLPGGLLERRADVGRSRGRGRLLAECGVLALTVVGVALLARRDPAAGTSAGVDPLVAAVPLLLALSACVLVLRVYPWPLRAVERVLRRRRDLPLFLGAARAVREPAGGLVPAAALVVGVGVAVFSAVLTSTLAHAVESTAWRSLGADIRISGPLVGPDLVERVAAADGVAGVARMADAGRVHLTGAGDAQRVALVAVDALAMQEVQSAAVGVTPVPTTLTRDDGGRLPVLAGAAVGVAPGQDGLRLALGGGVEVAVVGVADAVGGARVDAGAVVVDAARLEELTGTELRPRVLLVDVADGADPEAVLERVRAAAPGARVESLASATATYLDAPMTAGTAQALRVAVGLSAVLVVVALVLTQMLAAPRRASVLAVLRALGLARRGSRHVVAWELAPLALAALVAGAVLGVAVPAVVLGALDVAVLTGGPTPPRPVLDPLVLGGVVAGLLAVTAAAVAVSTSISSRADVAARLRLGEDG